MKVELVTHTPNADLLVANAARASFGKESHLVWWENAVRSVQTDLAMDDVPEFVRDKKEKYKEWLAKEEESKWTTDTRDDFLTLKYEDYNLINFLARERHLLPFRHPHITLRCKAPMFVARQLGKHQTGMTWSEESRRYIDSDPEFFWPDKWRKRADNVKQGSSDEELTEMLMPASDDWVPVNEVAEDYLKYANAVYQDALSSGMAPEQARMFLPQNMKVTWVWTGSLLGWVYMIRERSHPTAQKETRDFAAMVRGVVEDIAPVSVAALTEHWHD